MSLGKCPGCKQHAAVCTDEEYYDAYTGEAFESNNQALYCSACLCNRDDLELHAGRVVRKEKEA